MELLQQVNQQQLNVDCVIHATGSAGTQAGLVTGLRATHANIPVLGIGVNAARQTQEEKVYKLAMETADFIGAGGCMRREDVVANCDYVGDGYGIATGGMREALLTLARLEGLLFDPVYSGKGLAGMIDLVKKGEFKAGQNIVFIHTGGSAGLFGYLEEIL
jgi:L-cysteate sulfo-lyase